MPRDERQAGPPGTPPPRPLGPPDSGRDGSRRARCPARLGVLHCTAPMQYFLFYTIIHYSPAFPVHEVRRQLISYRCGPEARMARAAELLPRHPPCSPRLQPEPRLWRGGQAAQARAAHLRRRLLLHSPRIVSCFFSRCQQGLGSLYGFPSLPGLTTEAVCIIAASSSAPNVSHTLTRNLAAWPTACCTTLPTMDK
jgi:hypothetical protein